MAKWPKDEQSALIEFYGQPGTDAMARNLVRVIPPFRMTYEGKPVTHLMFHKLAAAALERALKRVWDYYGRDQAKVDALGISKYAGTYAPRKIRGSDTKWSNHAYGAAIDINAEQNGFNVVGNIPIPMIAAFKAEGARWGGDYKNRPDPMHFEFCQSGEPERTFEQWLEFYGHKGGGDAPVIVPKPLPAVTTSDLRRRMAKAIVSYEARRDAKGHLAVFKLDPQDGGGEYEVAGINDRYHPDELGKIRMLLAAGKYAEAETVVEDYVLNYTKGVVALSSDPGVEFYLRDCAFNRGPTGAVKILQIAVGVDPDGSAGDKTKKALAGIVPADLLTKLRSAREAYERMPKGGKPGRDESSQFWRGLVNRWNNSLAQARKFQAEKPAAKVTPESATAGAAGAAGAAAVAVAVQQGASTGTIIGIIVAVIVIAVSSFLIIRAARKK